jgi:hypothetical protein
MEGLFTSPILEESCALERLLEIALAPQKRTKCVSAIELRGIVSRLAKRAGMPHLLLQVYKALCYKGQHL